MTVLQKLERKMRFLAYPRLMLGLVIAYAAGFIINMVAPGLMNYLVFAPNMIFSGQVWRLLTFVMVPNTDNFFIALLTCFIYFSISSSLERIIGRWQVNFFLVTGIIIEILAGFLYYFMFANIGTLFLVSLLNPYYLYAMMFVIFALIYPDARFLFMFFIPVRGKWMIFITLGLYAIDVAASFMQGSAGYGWLLVFMIVAAVLNLLLFMLLAGYRPGRRGRRPENVVNMNAQRKNRARQESAPRMAYRHKCTLCGRTDKSNPELDFRYCSKCKGEYEYCSDHLYTHVHVGTENPGES